MVSFQDKMGGAEPTHGSGSGVWSLEWAKRDGSGRRKGKRGKASGIKVVALVGPAERRRQQPADQQIRFDAR